VGGIVLGYAPERQDMIADPIAMAAWFGLLATCLNLFPIWQLDGGHIAYALFGREKQKRLSIASLLALGALSFVGWPIPSYLAFCLLLLVFGAKHRFYHPPTMADWEEMDRPRIFLGAVALIILAVSFTPVPVSIP
jgi:membrane-associated protease RseP (regulator of RpoE activity)